MSNRSIKIIKIEKTLFGQHFSFNGPQELKGILACFGLIESYLFEEKEEEEKEEEIDKKGQFILSAFKKIDELMKELKKKGVLKDITSFLKGILGKFLTSLDKVASCKFSLFIYWVKGFVENPELFIMCELVDVSVVKIADLFLSLDTANAKVVVEKILATFPVEEFYNRVSSTARQSDPSKREGDGISLRIQEVNERMSYVFGLVCERFNNHRIANAYYEYSAERGYIQAMINFASNTLHGVGCESDVNKAIQLYEEVLKLDSREPNTCLILGIIYGGLNPDFVERVGLNQKDRGYELLRKCWNNGLDFDEKNTGEMHFKRLKVGLYLGKTCLLGHWGKRRIRFGENILKKLSRKGIARASFILAKIKFIRNFDNEQRKEALQELCNLFRGDSITFFDDDDYSIVFAAFICCVKLYKPGNQLDNIEACIKVMRSRFKKEFDNLLIELNLENQFSTSEFILKAFVFYFSKQHKISNLIESVNFIVRDVSKSPKDKINDIFSIIDQINEDHFDVTRMEAFIEGIADCFYKIGSVVRNLGASKTEVIDCLRVVREKFQDVKKKLDKIYQTSHLKSINDRGLKVTFKLVLSVRDLSIFPEGEMAGLLEYQIRVIHQSLSSMGSDLLNWALIIHTGACIGLPESIINSAFLAIISEFIKQDNIERFLPLVYYSLALLSVGDEFFMARDSNSPPYSEACREKINNLARNVKEKISGSKLSLAAREEHQVMMADSYFRDDRKRYFSKVNLSEEVKDEEVSSLLPKSTVSRLQSTVFRSIQNVFSRKSSSAQAVEITQETIVGPLSRDIVAKVDEETIIFEVNGPTHFVFDEEMNPRKTPKHFLHEKCLPKGAVIINIDYNEELPDGEAREQWAQYLQEKTQKYADQIPQFVKHLDLAVQASKTSKISSSGLFPPPPNDPDASDCSDANSVTAVSLGSH